ncbi:rod shape-determining protein MreD [Sporomusa sp. KB1]|jgi:rod shape-determining protein MreD|uniref:rod shape-determining protein MreD n=1 Tax=Sporomusa sp. KB1 TaxID=943346 RepID=UPI0011ADA65A|nr:rod shape-determining protein MreD [Sporomusa sp. KB1]TWH48215.1 rod shape-determining protein MreD [Sporomusa sp. KB1]
MKMILVWASLLIVTIAVQAVLLPLIFTQGAKPDIILIIVVACGLLAGREHAIGVGFMAGLLQDFASGNIFGLNTLSKMAIGYVAGLAERKVFKESVVLPVLAIILATFFNGVIIQALLFLLGYKVEVMSMLKAQMLASLGYNILFCIPVHRLIYRLTFGDRSQF